MTLTINYDNKCSIALGYQQLNIFRMLYNNNHNTIYSILLRLVKSDFNIL